MPVAKSYMNYPTVGQPFAENKRQYVMIKTANGERKVRWYTDAEFNHMYPELAVKAVNYREVLGFKKAGYITVYPEVKDEDEPLFRANPNCYYHKVWHWYTPSDKEVMEGFATKQLSWAAVSTPDGKVTPESAKKGYIKLLHPYAGNFVGKVGDRIELNIKVTAVLPVLSSFGEKCVIIMQDEKKNELVWFTTKALSLGEYRMRVTIKKHQVYDGKNQTIVNRCTIVKE